MSNIKKNVRSCLIFSFGRTLTYDGDDVDEDIINEDRKKIVSNVPLSGSVSN